VRKKLAYLYLFVAFLLTGAVALYPGEGFADEEPACREPISVSRDLAPFSAFAHLVADPYGRVHLIWSSGIVEGRNEEQVETDTIFYTVFDGEQWSQPVDILTAADYASAHSLALTADDHLLIAWRARNGGSDDLRLSRAPLDTAGSAQAWETRDLFAGGVQRSDLFVDSAGRVHLVYAAHDPAYGVGHIGYFWSGDGGVTWTQGADLASIDPSRAVNAAVQVYVDDLGTVHIVWSRHLAENSWMSHGVWYARSTDEGMTWSEPEEVFGENKAAYPNLAKGGDEQRLYMTWLRGVGYKDSKYLRLSTDRGFTWGEPQLLFENLQGLNGTMPLVVDAAGAEYLVMSGDTEGATKILFSQRSESGAWSMPVSLSAELHDSEFPDAVILNGNQLHVVWNDFVEDDIYHVICTLDAPAIPPQPLPAAPVAVGAEAAPPTRMLSPTSAAATLTPEPGVTLLSAPQEPGPDGAGTRAGPVLIGVLAAIVLVVPVLGWRLRSGKW